MTLHDIVAAFATKDRSIRILAEFSFDILQQEGCIKAGKLPNDFFQQKAGRVYSHATTEHELKALQLALWCLYELMAEANPNLIAPAQFMPRKKLPTVFTEQTPPLAIQAFLHQRADELINHERPLVRAISIMLKLSMQIGLSNKKTLLALILSKNQTVVFSSANRACIHIEGEEIWLDAMAILLLRRIRELSIKKQMYSSIESEFNNWWSIARVTLVGYADNEITFSYALKALSFLGRPPAQTALAEFYHPLSLSDLINAFANQKIRMDTDEVIPINARRARKVEFVVANELSVCLTVPNKIAFNPSFHSPDTQLIKQFRNALTQFKDAQPDEKRQGKPYKTVKKNIEHIIDSCRNNNDKISCCAALIINYCADLFFNGSAWKSRLAVNSINTYLSTLTGFAANAWSDELLLQEAQYDLATLYEVSHLVVDVLSDLGGLDKQSTVLVFLQFLKQFDGLNFFDADELEFLGVRTAACRAHYINPWDFDQTILDFISDLDTPERRHTIIFVRMCYFLGLRYQEAAGLTIADIDFDSEFVYITTLSKRKSPKAVRHVPMCFLPIQFQNDIQEFIQKRALSDTVLVFDEAILSSVLPDFISLLRRVCNNNELVVHSLRHSAANNIFIILCNEAFRDSNHGKMLSTTPCLQHPQFDDGLQKLVANTYSSLGRPLNIYSPVLGILSEIMGHVSPAVTVANYLHLFGYICFELNAARTQLILGNQLLAVLPQNNYRFNTAAQYESLLKVSAESAENFLFRRAIHGFSGMKVSNGFNVKSRVFVRKHVTLNDYVSALLLYKYGSTHSGEPAFQTHFNSICRTLDVHILLDIPPRNYPAWLRLLDRFSRTDWSPKNLNSVNALGEALLTGKITEKRQLTQFLRAISLLGLSTLEFKLFLPYEATISDDWGNIVERYGHRVRYEKATSKETYIAALPCKLRWPCWQYLPVILSLLKGYIQFITVAGISNE